MIAPPRTTYSSHEVPAATRDVYREAIDAALKPHQNFSPKVKGKA